MTRQIFRPAALQRYNDRFDKVVLPDYVSPPWLPLLWGCCGLLLIGTVLLWAVEFPLYAEGTGVVVAVPAEMDNSTQDNPDTITPNKVMPNKLMVVAFLPAASATQLAVNQRVLLRFAALDSYAAPTEPDVEVTSVVTAVEPEILAPAIARARYQLDSSTGLLVEGPVRAALIPIETQTPALLGSVGEVKIEIGSQRGIGLIPGLGHFFVVDSSQ